MRIRNANLYLTEQSVTERRSEGPLGIAGTGAPRDDWCRDAELVPQCAAVEFGCRSAEWSAYQQWGMHRMFRGYYPERRFCK